MRLANDPRSETCVPHKSSVSSTVRCANGSKSETCVSHKTSVSSAVRCANGSKSETCVSHKSSVSNVVRLANDPRSETCVCARESARIPSLFACALINPRIFRSGSSRRRTSKTLDKRGEYTLAYSCRSSNRTAAMIASSRIRASPERGLIARRASNRARFITGSSGTFPLSWEKFGPNTVSNRSACQSSFEASNSKRNEKVSPHALCPAQSARFLRSNLRGVLLPLAQLSPVTSRSKATAAKYS